MDSWCKPVIAKTGNRVSGGAARNVRIADYENGMDDIIEEVAVNAAKDALERANRRVRTSNMRLAKSA